MGSSNSTSDQLSEEQILAQPESSYMNAEQLAFFRQKLLELHESTCARIKEASDEMASPMACSDANDRASYEEQANIALRIVEREQKLLPKIRQSLERISAGTYGYCLESGEPIGIARLLVRPTAEYCSGEKAIKELQENQYKG